MPVLGIEAGQHWWEAWSLTTLPDPLWNMHEICWHPLISPSFLCFFTLWYKLQEIFVCVKWQSCLCKFRSCLLHWQKYMNKACKDLSRAEINIQKSKYLCTDTEGQYLNAIQEHITLVAMVTLWVKHSLRYFILFPSLCNVVLHLRSTTHVGQLLKLYQPVLNLFCVYASVCLSSYSVMF